MGIDGTVSLKGDSGRRIGKIYFRDTLVNDMAIHLYGFGYVDREDFTFSGNIEPLNGNGNDKQKQRSYIMIENNYHRDNPESTAPIVKCDLLNEWGSPYDHMNWELNGKNLLTEEFQNFDECESELHVIADKGMLDIIWMERDKRSDILREEARYCLNMKEVQSITTNQL